MHIDPDRMDVAVFHRDDEGGWSGEIYTNPSDLIELAGTPAVLTLAEIYEGLASG